MLLAPRSAWCGGVRLLFIEDLREGIDRLSAYWHLRSSAVHLASNFKSSSEKGYLTLAFWGSGPGDQLVLVSPHDLMMRIRVTWLA